MGVRARAGAGPRRTPVSRRRAHRLQHQARAQGLQLPQGRQAALRGRLLLIEKMEENIAPKAKLTHAQKEALRRANLVAKGLCYVCARNPVSGKDKDCQACKQRRKQYSARVRARYRSEGRCGCGRQTSEGKRNCSSCTARS